MTVSLRNTPAIATSLGVSTFSVATSWSTATVKGDLLVAVQTLSGNGTTVLGSTPAGWLLSSINESATDVRTAIYTKIAAGSDSAPTFAGSITSGTAADCGSTVLLYDFYDSSGGTPVLTTAGIVTGTSGTVAPVTAGAAVVAGSYAIASLAGYASTAATFTWTTPAGWATQGKSGSSTHYQYAHWSLSGPTAGATLTCSMAHTVGTSTEEAALIAVIAPPGIYHVGDSTSIAAALSGTTQTNTYASQGPISSGSNNTLVAYASAYINGNTAISLSSITDTASNTWTKVQGTSGYYTSSAYTGCCAGGFCVGAAAVTTVTITWSAIPGDNSIMQVSEFIGVPTGAVLDGSASASFGGTSETSLATPSITPTATTDIVIGNTAANTYWSGVTPGAIINQGSGGAGFGLAAWQIIKNPNVSYADTFTYSANNVMATQTFAIGLPRPSSSDSGTGVDSGAPIINQMVSDSDSATGLDSYGQDAYGSRTALSSENYGAGLYGDYFYLQISPADSGTGVDTAYIVSETISSSDSGTGVDTQSVNQGSTPVSSSDTGTGAEGTHYSIQVNSTGESGSGSDTGLPNATLAGNDSGTGAESTNYSVRVNGTGESGSGSDTGLPNATLAGNDSGTGAENWAIYVASSDSGTGVESGLPNATLLGSDTGSGAEGVYTIAVNSSDTAAGVETGQLASSLANSDSGSGAEGSIYVITVTSLGDTGTGVDGGLPSATLTNSDTGTGADATTYAIQISSTGDTGSGQDTSPNDTDHIFDVDAGTGAENWAIYVYSADAGSGAESYGVEIDTIFAYDTGTGTEGPAVIKVNSSDTGAGVEANTPEVDNIFGVDAATGVDSGLPGANLAGSDSGTGADATIYAITIDSTGDAATGVETYGPEVDTEYDVDVGTGSENSAYVIAISDFDYAAGAETGPNLLSANNSTFVTSAGNWSPQGNVTGTWDSTQGYDSPSSLLVTGTSVANSGNGVYEGAYCAVPPGSQFQISMWVKTTYSGQTIDLYAYTYANAGGGGAEISLASGALSLSGDGNWHYFSYVFRQPAGPPTYANAAQSALASVKFPGLATGQTINIDEVRLQVFSDVVTASVSSSDAGTGAESTFIAATTFIASDVGSGADLALPVQATLATSDTSTGVEGGVPEGVIGDIEGGTGSESSIYVIMLNSPDSGSGVDSGFLINTGSNISSEDTGSGDDEGYVVSETIADTDFGSGVETTSLFGLPADVDAATGDDESFIGVEYIYAQDSGVGVTIVPALIVSVSGTESGTGADTSNLADNLADSGTGADTASIAATLQDVDAGTGVENWAVYVSSSDTGSGADTYSPVLAFVSITDIGTGADVSKSVPATLSAAETGFGDLLEAVLVGVNDAVGMP